MKVKFKAESNIWEKKETRAGVVIFELLPSLTFRHVDWELGKEFNIYLSWLLWTVSATFSSTRK